MERKRVMEKGRLARWYHFQAISGDRSILRGSSSTEDRRFKPRSRGRQASAAAAVALVYAQLFDACNWTESFIDRVLEYGDRLFRTSQTRSRLGKNEYMSCDLLHDEFFVGDYKCRVCIESGTVFGNVWSENVGAPCLSDGLKHFLESRNFGVLTSQGVTAAIWRETAPKDEGFFYFDPAPTDEQGKRNRSGFACIMRFTEIYALLEVFLSNFDEKADSRYCIDKLSLIRVKPIGRAFQSQTQLPDTKLEPALEKKLLQSINPADSQMSTNNRKVQCAATPDKLSAKHANRDFAEKLPIKIEMTNCTMQEKLAEMDSLADRTIVNKNYSYECVKANVPASFVALDAADSGIMILHGWTHESSDLYKAKGAQSTANCLMAIGLKKLHPVRTWLRKNLDEVLALGDEFFAQVKATKPNIKTMTAADFNGASCEIENRKIIVDVDLMTIVGTVISKYPAVLNLQSGLKEFFVGNKEGVLECPLLSFAIWTQEDYFYIFDSKSCDMFGLHAIEQKKVGKKDKAGSAAGSKEKNFLGKCCVMRFPKLSLLCSHILKNLDPKMSNERFTIRRVDIVDDLPGIRDWNSFKPAMAGISWILQGNFNSEDESFDDHSRGVQGLAMPIVALVSAKSIAPANWTKEDVDEVLREADAYYNWCINLGGEVDDEDKNMTFRNLKPILYYKKCRTVLEVEEFCVIGDLSQSNIGSDSFLPPSMERGIRDFFENRQFAVVEAKKKYYAIWKWEEELKDKSKQVAYYLFNDKPDERLAWHAESDADLIGSANKEMALQACVLRFLELGELGKTLMELLRDQNDDEESDEHNDDYDNDDEKKRCDFFIHSIKVASISDPMSEEDIEKDKATPLRPELKNYSVLADNGAFLVASFGQNDEFLFKKDTRDKQQAASALLTLAMTKLVYPHLWHGQILDDILRMADKLTRENANNILEIDEEYGDAVGRNYLLPSEIQREFDIGVNAIVVELEEDAASGKLSDLEKILRDFFINGKMAIFRYEQTILPIWKESENVFFSMDPRGSRQNGNAVVYFWYNMGLVAMAEFLMEILHDSTEDEFNLDSVSIENRYTESERSTQQFVTDENWYNFVKVSDGICKIDCSISLDDEIFEKENRAKQSAAVCVIAIIFSKVNEPRHWTTEILDEVIITGDKLHSQSAIRLGENRIFQPNEIIGEFFLADRRIELIMQDCKQAGTLGGKSAKIQNLTSGLERFFDDSVAGCVSIGKFSVLAIWFCENSYYSFEPGLFLKRFELLSLLAGQLLSYGEVETDFEITSIEVVDLNKLPPWKFDPSPGVRPSNLPPLNAYSNLTGGRARAILRGSTHQASDVFCETIRGHQSAANCIIALAMSVIKNPVTWTRKTVDEILTIGLNVHRQSLKYTRNINISKTLRPKEIIRIFYVGVNILAVDVEENTISGIVATAPPEPEEKASKKGKKPKSKPPVKGKKKGKTSRVSPLATSPILLEEGLARFFENNNAGIIVTGRFMVAVWKDNGVYFVYDPMPRNDQGLKDVNQEGCSCVVWYACLEPLYELICANVNDDEKYGSFLINKVIVRTVSIEPLPAPAGYLTVGERSDRLSKKTDCPMPAIRMTSLLEPPRAMNVDLESSFERIDRDVSVLLASSHMSSRVYPSENRGLQSSAISAVAIVVSSLHAPSGWTSDLVNAIIKYGDVFHTECVRLAQPGSRNLSPSELLEVFVVGDVRARICIRKNLMAGISLEVDLASALRLFFDSNAQGILHTANLALPIFKHCSQFYVLDPSENNEFANNSRDGFASLIKCESLTKLTNILIRLFAFKQPIVYTLNAVQVLDLHFFPR